MAFRHGARWMKDTMEESGLGVETREKRDDSGSGGLERGARRVKNPGIGSFAVIAAAVLMVFGAASRMGKNPEIDSLFGLDRQTHERVRREEERLKGMLILGGVLVAPAGQDASGAADIDFDAPPPLRGDFPLPLAGKDDGSGPGRPSRMSLAANGGLHGGGAAGTDGDASSRLASGGDPFGVDADGARGGVDGGAGYAKTTGDRDYVVRDGDTWVKIARRTLGDGGRWRELQSANAEAGNGLRVGMRLVIPD